MTTEDRNQHFFGVINPELCRLAGRICEASAIDDRVLEQSRYKDLLTFYEEQVAEGYWHPSLTESVADFTAIRDSPAVAQFLGPANWQISKVRMSCLNRARDAINLVAAAVDALGFVEHASFGEYLGDGRAPTHGVVFTEDVVQIAGQQV